ncbi:MAG: biopolymer transporter ExbD [Candidatus Thiodiazotropha sp. (ex Lucinoma borealis)]|nr:biopolymer transporter ExbD [Candidatus Thiodiazotropha sp. (ex Lucinoma borealis)]MCU7854489.1 biopolymer transporter ExbD [Candidatus Thiodiazotropha sp. (ex Lucinoma borealis)]MCU7862561.1 biopolymer transporter ExbD [Candidatus Thiodiazotropha sp. (ex Lucinoma borealis)]MCU7870252.1 biopolymer transporter ExbD [Candidatus Thiodiazotropha sp. (ex Lucinoma borealis)]MCU7945043.1 biopolymer transporter ExbD [Candidatus Thiodiazotropha sp. (ex Cardiolucina cf. quadrata)]
MRSRLRHHHHEAELNITAFLNLMVILIPFLLITAAFSRFSIIELYLPPASEGTLQAIKELQLEVIIRKQGLEVADREGGLIRRLNNTPEGYDLKGLNELLVQIKVRFHDKRSIFILSEPDTNYETMVQVMDAVRMTENVEAGSVVQYELFPDIALGDAPPIVNQTLDIGNPS